MNIFGVNMKRQEELLEDRSTARIFVIADVNGNAALLKQAIAQIEAHPLASNDTIVLLGNYIGDSGSTRETINFLKVYRGFRDKQLVLLRGANEHKFITMNRKFLNSPEGLGVVKSYRQYTDAFALQATVINNPICSDKMEEDIKWLAKQPYFHISNQFVFVHSGLEPNKPLEKQDTITSLFIQEPFYKSSKFFMKDKQDGGKEAVMVIHANSASPTGEVEFKTNRVDLGAAITDAKRGKEVPVVVLWDNKIQPTRPEVLTAFVVEKPKETTSMIPPEDETSE